ncbi:hypothetical protein RFI_19668, partial [Reticulomyxa filosa]
KKKKKKKKKKKVFVVVVRYLQERFALNGGNGSLNGTSPSGDILMIGWHDQVNDPLSSNMFALEMDRLQNTPRFPNQTLELPLNNFIVAANHFRLLGVNVTANQNFNSQTVYGLNVAVEYWRYLFFFFSLCCHFCIFFLLFAYNSSSWRYITGVNKVLSLNRTQPCIDGHNDMISMLKAVAHGTTEHSVIVHVTSQDTIEFWLAVAAVDGQQWDAPYRPFHKFLFDDIFQV